MYTNFEYYTPTKVVFGKGTVGQLGGLIKAHGGSKVLLHFGGQSAKKSGLLDQVKKSLDDAGISYVELGGVVPNPHVGKVYGRTQGNDPLHSGAPPGGKGNHRT